MNIEKSLNIIIYKTVDALSVYVTDFISFILRNRDFALTFVITAIFYLPALKNGSINAGFLYGGDVLGWYLPALAKTHTLLHSFNFTAIDYSAFNGSSDFFLSPNFFAYHPLVVIFCLVVPPESINLQQLGHFLVLLVVFHSFISFYFTLKLFTRFFNFDFGSAALIATVFAFSMHMVSALGQPPFFFCASIISWAAYSSLAFAEKPNLRLLIFACLPIIIGFMGGYMPIGIASLALSAVLIATKLLFIDDTESPFNNRLRDVFLAWMPYVFSSIIVAPYLYSVYKFHQETSSVGVVSLFYSAHQLSQLPQSLLQSLSTHFSVPGPMHEFSLAWGIIAIVIAAIFLFSSKVIDKLSPREWMIYKIFAIIYFATVLATFGNYSVVSDLVYYLIPQVGGMHIYQRFFLPAQLVFSVMLVVMLKAVIQSRPLISIRIVLALLGTASVIVAYFVAYKPVLSQEIGLNNYLVFELILGFLFLCTLIVPNKNFIYGVAIVLMLLPVLDRMYDYTLHGHTLQEQRKRQVIALNKTERAQLVSYLKRFGGKDVIKYVDITPMWSEGGVETFPKVFPYFVLKEIQLSSYGGFTFYLSARADYMSKMPVRGNVEVKPDWEYIVNSGADFVVARESDLQKGALSSMFAQTKHKDLYKLPNGAVIVPLRELTENSHLTEDVLFDNGYFKISSTNSKKKLINIAVGKSVRQSSGGRSNAKLAVDGNTDGDFTHGSVTHSGKDANAWFEIDLGQVESIDSVRVWNRTDCCGERLRDYWMFISEYPFRTNETAQMLQKRPSTWSKINLTPNPKSTIKTHGVQGRYVRIQFSGTQPLAESFLSLAEIEVFRSVQNEGNTLTKDINSKSDLKVDKFTTDYASYLRLDLDSSAPSIVQYLFWDNPRLNYYLNGERVKLTGKDGVRKLEVPAGHNTIEIKYRHWPLKIFWFLYTMYALMFLWFLKPTRTQIIFIWEKLHWLREFSRSKW